MESALGWSQSSSEGGFASTVFAEDRLRPLAAALGIDEVRATLGFRYFEEERASLPDGLEDLVVPELRSPHGADSTMERSCAPPHAPRGDPPPNST